MYVGPSSIIKIPGGRMTKTSNWSSSCCCGSSPWMSASNCCSTRVDRADPEISATARSAFAETFDDQPRRFHSISSSSSSANCYSPSSCRPTLISPNKRTLPNWRKGMSECVASSSSTCKVSNLHFLVILILITISLAAPSYCMLEDESSSSSISLPRQVEPQVLQRLESQFLKLFKMERRPRRQRGQTLEVPKYLIDMYEAQTGLVLPTSNLNLPGRHTRTANTVRTFYDDNKNYENTQHPNHHHLQFDLTSIPPEEEVTGAELRIPFHIIPNQKLGDGSEIDSESVVNKVRVIVSDVSKRISKKLRSDPIAYPVDSKIVDLERKRKEGTVWLTVDVFPAIARWLKEPKRNHGILVQVFDAKTGQLISEAEAETVDNRVKHLRLKRGLPDDTHQSSGETPVLFTYSDDGLHKRRTRDAPTLSRHYRSAQENRNKQHRNRGKGQRHRGRKRNHCARHKMFVDFTDVGWNDWIVAPPGYEAHHCGGECSFPMADHLNATNHAVIQALVNSMNPQLVPPPCCVPTKYASLSLLYNDASDKIVLKNYNEMVVEACGCS